MECQRSETRRRAALIFGLVIVWIGANVIAWQAGWMYESAELAARFGVAADVIRQFDSDAVSVRVRDDGGASEIRYRFRGPSYWAPDRSLPLLVYLHGSGDRGFDNVLPLNGPPSVLCESGLQARFPCCILVPQCPSHLDWTSDFDSGTDMLDIVLAMIERACADRRIDPQKIYLAGFSMGGFGAWHLAARAPGRFAAVVPIAGGAHPELADDLIRVNLWAVHGMDDDVVPIEGSRAMIEAIRAQGGTPQFSELSDVGHPAWRTVFRENSDVLEWMFRQVRD